MGTSGAGNRSNHQAPPQRARLACARPIPLRQLSGRPRDGFLHCPDHEVNDQTCKHLLAVRFTIRRERGENGSYKYTKVAQVTYTQEWTAYNAAQCEEKDRFLELLGDLCAILPEPAERHVRGRRPLPLSVQTFASVYKVYSRLSSRRFTSDLRDANAKGLIPMAPHFNSVNNAISNPEMTEVLKHLITVSAMPLKAVETDFAVDSTGFSTSRFIRWYNKKYGQETDNREWVKLHAMCGVRTNVVTAAEMTGWTAADTNYFKPLVQVTAENFDMEQVSADKAYLSHANVDFVEKFGATPFIPFKSNTKVFPPRP